MCATVLRPSKPRCTIQTTESSGSGRPRRLHPTPLCLVLKENEKTIQSVEAGSVLGMRSGVPAKSKSGEGSDAATSI